MTPQLRERSELSCQAECDPTPSMYYVYVLRNHSTGNLYYGYTNNLERRMREHGKSYPVELVYYEAYKVESDARHREWQLKHHAQALTALKARLPASLGEAVLGVGFNSDRQVMSPGRAP